ncbi:MAG: response regulator [Candidatus Moranbacteria bacterium CG23_combo_of_CG06-09_8_20_14_all_39_10]|nr:MAG: response regulator [Candidatus Moranbacteria bacterium CG23_combo_of_CG06-09_8_20_14_all_39_10]
MSKIIIVEDDPMIAEIYQKKFSDSGFEVFMATNGDQALNLAKVQKPDVIMTDLIMSRMDGFQLIEALRSGEEYDPNIKIIVTSNLSQTEDREKAEKLGANGFVAKSEYSPSDLVKEVQRLISK